MIAELAAFLALLQSAPPSAVQLGEVEVRLFYKSSGRLSDNVLSRREPFVFHNAIIGEGDLEEPADDLLVSVQMTAGRFGAPEDKHRYADAPVELVAVDAAGKILGRRVHDSVLTSLMGTEHKVLWLNDVTCAGEVTITATYAGQRKNATVNMGCGE